VLEVVEVVGDQDPQDVDAGGVRGQLQQEAFSEVAGADARRVEPLDEPERLLNLLDGHVVAEVAGHVVQRDVLGQIAVVVEVVDDVLGQRPEGRIGVEEAELLGQLVVERLGARGHVLHGLLFAVALFNQGRAAAAGALVVQFAPIFVEVDQALEIGLVGFGPLGRLGGRLRGGLVGLLISRRRRLAEVDQNRVFA